MQETPSNGLTNRLSCRLGFHKWLYKLPDFRKSFGGDDVLLKWGMDMRESHCVTCKCTWLTEGVMRVCVRKCGTRHTWRSSGNDTPLWK
mgnify:CR=1 FL=1